MCSALLAIHGGKTPFAVILTANTALPWLLPAMHFTTRAAIPTHMTHPLLKLKHSILLAMHGGKTPFAVI